MTHFCSVFETFFNIGFTLQQQHSSVFMMLSCVHHSLHGGPESEVTVARNASLKISKFSVLIYIVTNLFLVRAKSHTNQSGILKL